MLQRAEGVGHLDRLADAGHERGDGGVGREGHRAGDRLDEDEAERVHVGLAVDGLALGLLRRGVAGGAEHGALRLGPRRLGQGAGQAEVGDAQPAVVAEQEVGGLDVAVDEAAAVGVVEGPGGLEADEQGLRRREPDALVEHGAQAAAAEVLGDDVGRAVVVAPVVDGDDVRVVQGRGRLRLGPEAAEEGVVVGEGGVQDLHRDPAAEAHVVGQEDLGRRAGADGGDEPIPPAQDATDLVRHAGHDHAARVSGGPGRPGAPLRRCEGPDWRRWPPMRRPPRTPMPGADGAAPASRSSRWSLPRCCWAAATRGGARPPTRATATDTGERCPARPDVVEHLVPEPGDEVVRQAELGIDLAPGLRRHARRERRRDPRRRAAAACPEQNQVFFTPGRGQGGRAAAAPARTAPPPSCGRPPTGAARRTTRRSPGASRPL